MTPQEIFEKVKVEIARGQAKHGKWTDLTDHQQFAAIHEEFAEYCEAFWAKNKDGEHGEIAEAVQTITVLMRRIMFLTGEDQ